MLRFRIGAIIAMTVAALNIDSMILRSSAVNWLEASQDVRWRVGRTFNAYVVTIADGDTVELIPEGEPDPIRIRLEGIDAPELDEPYGRDAMIYTRLLLLKKRVQVDGRDVDRYQRLVARVTAAGRDVSLALLQMGLACHFTQFRSDAVLADAQAQARNNGTGFWAAKAPKPRCTGSGTAPPKKKPKN